MGKPRIAVVTPYWPFPGMPYRGQSAYQTLLLLQDRADIAAFCPVPSYPGWLRRGKPSGLDGAFKPAIPTEYIQYPAVPALSRGTNGWVSGRYVLPALRQFRPDLLLNYWIYPEGYAAVMAGRKLGRPVILCSIGSDLKRLPGAITRSLTQKTLAQADFVMAVSEDLRNEAVRLGADAPRTATVQNGCDLSVFAPAEQSAARTSLGVVPNREIIVFVGFLSEAKGLRELARAMEQLLPARPNLTAVLIGEGVLRQELEGAKGIQLAGRQTSAQIAQWMAAANVFCLPSYSEGCPNAVVEALACGCPVVATNVGGIPDLVEDSSGILVPARDSAALAAALDQALSRSWDRAAIARQNRRSWADAAEETWRICTQVLARHDGSKP